ncbi:MAG: sigma-70 family RNA polymerase sigma factor [Planctomycetota bacterium]|jgi:RNA polymerase sigma-70 factor (ECF subfamily)
MSDSSLPLDAQALLEHTRGLRAIARRLLQDDQQVDDVLQETWLAALRAPPDLDRPLGGWLAKVARNFALMRRRAAQRRRRHERRAARPGPEPSPAEIVERFEMQRLVARSVAELEEPYRATLLLRYFEDLAPAEIAARSGEPPGTVRSRLKRGLERLRARLDAEHGGDRRSCLLSLAAVAGLAEQGTAMVATALATKAKLGLAAALIVVAGVFVWRAARGAAEPDAQERAATRPPAAERAAPSASAATARAEVASAPDPTARVVIEGRILAPWGAGMAGAEVYVFAPWRGHPADGPELCGRARTGSDGTFVIPTTATGRLSLAAKARGCGWGHQHLGKRRRDLELTLYPARETSGLVVDGAGDPVPGARVRLAGIPASEVRTDRDGAFRLEVARFHDVEVWHPDFMPRRDRLGRIQLGRGAVLEGALRSHGERTPVPGATVHVFGTYEHTATTDAGGRFALRHDLRERGRPYLLWVEAGRQGTLLVRVPWTPGHPLELVLGPTRTLTGHVLTTDGRRPVSGAVVGIAHTGAEADLLEGPPRREAVSQADGSFRVEGVATRQVQLSVRHPEHALAHGPNAEYVAAGGDAEIEVLVAPRLHLAGRVLGPDGKPLADARFRVVRAGDPSHLGPDQFRGARRTDARGRFQMRWPARTYYPRVYEACELVVLHPDFEMVRSERFAPVPGSRHVLEVRLVKPRPSRPRRQITGLVEDRHGAPVPMAHLLARAAGEGGGGQTYSAPDGRFRLEDLSDGSYALQCTKAGFVWHTLPGVAAGSDVVIALQPGHVFRGRLVDDAGKAVAGVKVGQQPWGQIGGYVRTRRDGSFEFENEAPGDYRLRLVQAEALDEDSLRFTVPCEEVVAFVVRRLPPPPVRKLFSIEGRVLFRSDRAFPVGTLVTVRAQGPDWSEATCDLEGRFAFAPGLPEGRYTLTVHCEGNERGIFEPLPDVAAGTKDLVLRPVDTGTISGVVCGPDGRLVPHAHVNVVVAQEGGRRRFQLGEGATCDRAGRFSLAHLVDGVYTLVAQHGDYGPTYRAGVAWDETDVRLVLSVGHVLAGRVLAPDGQPLEDAKALVWVFDARVVRRHATTEEDGTFAVRGLPDGPCKVVVYVAQRNLYWEREGVPADTRNLTPRLEALSREEIEARFSRR